MQLTISNTVIPLDAGISLPLVLRSPLFLTDEGKIPGSYIFNFPVPAGEIIRRVFGQAHRVQRGGTATAELPYVITSGSLRYSGTCVVTEASKDIYQVACRIGNGDFTSKLAGKTLKDLDLGDDQTLTDLCSVAHLSDTIELNQEDPEYLEQQLTIPDEILADITGSFTDSGRTFTAPDDMDCTLKIHVAAAIILGSVHVKVNKNAGLLDETYYNSGNENGIFTLSLSLSQGDVITIEAIAESEVALTGYSYNLWLHEFAVEYTKTNIFTTTAGLDQNDSDFAVFPIYNSEFLSNFPDDAFQLDNLSLKTIYTSYFPVLNYYKDGEFPLFLSGDAEGERLFCANLFTPFVYMRKLLNQIAEEAGFTIVNNPFDNIYFANMVLYNAYAENLYSSTSTTVLPVKTTFNLSDHVPALPQSDFIKHVAILTGYMPVIDNEALTLTFVNLKDKHVISETNPVIPFPGVLLPNPTVITEPEYKGIKFELKKASTDKYLENIKELSDKFVYKGEITDPRDLPTAGNTVNDLIYCSGNNKYYVFQYDAETYTLAWVFYSVKCPLVYTEGEEPYLTVSTDLCPILTTRILDEVLGAPENRMWTLPRTDQAGILEGFPDSLSAEYGLQVLYFKGMSLDSNADPYPLGTCRYDDYTGDPLLFPDISATGIFDSQYKTFLQWLAYTAKPATFKCILTRAQLQQIAYDQIYSWPGFNFLVKELKINLVMGGVSMGEVEIYTV